jgi:hypothetical protein
LNVTSQKTEFFIVTAVSQTQAVQILHINESENGRTLRSVISIGTFRKNKAIQNPKFKLLEVAGEKILNGKYQ